MNGTNTDGTGLGSLAAVRGLEGRTFQTPKPKVRIYINEVENGWTIHYNTSNFASGEEIRIARDFKELIVLLSNLKEDHKLQ